MFFISRCGPKVSEEVSRAYYLKLDWKMFRIDSISHFPKLEAKQKKNNEITGTVAFAGLIH